MRMTRNRPMWDKFILVSVLFTFLFSIGMVYAEPVHEPHVTVITRPEWVSGELAVYIHAFPQDGAELKQDTITVMASIWNADEKHPVYIYLDGEEAIRIETEGYFRYEWELIGSHQITIRDEFRLFRTSVFNIKAPPPPPLTISLTEFNQKLEKQFMQVFTLACTAAILGVPTGVWVKKKTKIMSEWGLIPCAVLAGFGFRYLPELYMLVPFAAVTAITYIFTRGYASRQVVLIASEGMIDFRDYTLDDEGYIVQDIGPQYWREGFIKRKRMTLVDNKYPIDFRYMGATVRCVTVAGPEHIKETIDEVNVTCSPELAHALSKKDVIERLESQVAKTNFKLIFMERALSSIISEAVLEMERIVEDLKLDSLTSVSEAQLRVEEAAEKMGSALRDQLSNVEGGHEGA